MSLPVTLALAGLCLLMAAVFGWRGALSPRPLAAPRMIPWRFLMLAAVAVVVMLALHAMNLLRVDG
jgi:hypothetical protein